MGLDRRDSMIGSTAARHDGHSGPLLPGGSGGSDGASASGLLERGELLQTLDHAVTKRITVVSAPPGSGKTSLLRAWADRSNDLHRVAFVSVDRDQQDAQHFWSAVLDAIRTPTLSVGAETQSAARALEDAGANLAWLPDRAARMTEVADASGVGRVGLVVWRRGEDSRLRPRRAPRSCVGPPCHPRA